MAIVLRPYICDVISPYLFLVELRVICHIESRAISARVGTPHPMMSAAVVRAVVETRRNIAKMLIVVVCMFALCYLPVHLINMLR